MTETPPPQFSELLPPEIINMIGRLEFLARTAKVGTINGRHTSPHKGFSVEFAEPGKGGPTPSEMVEMWESLLDDYDLAVYYLGQDGISSPMGGAGDLAGDLAGLDLAGLETIGQSGEEYLDDGLDALEFGGGGVDAEHAGEGEIMIVLADFAAEDPKEMSCKAQELVRFVRRPPEALDWALCQRLQGGAEGLVPASYLRGADGQMVAGFTAEDAGEVSAPEGMKVWQAEPTPTSAAGWSLVVLETGEKGLVPESYVSWTGGAPPFGDSAGAGGAGEDRADWAAYGGELLEEADLEAEIEAARFRLITNPVMDVLSKLTDRAYDLVILRHDPIDLTYTIDEAHRILRSGGVLVIDSFFGGGKVPDPAQRDPKTIALREAGKRIKTNRDHWQSSLLPVGDGLLIATKL